MSQTSRGMTARPVAVAPVEDGVSTAPVGVMDRTFAILNLLSTHAEGLQISTIAEQLGIPISATHRLLNDLIRHQMVKQEVESSTYRLTTRLMTMAFTWLAASGIVDVAQPILDRLAAATGELVRLSVIDGDGLTWVARAQGALSGLKYDPDMGRVAKLSCSSSGIAWLSSMPDKAALATVERQGFGSVEEFGPDAPQTARALLRHLKLTREQGYSVTMRTFAPWMAASAAIVRQGANGPVRGAVSIAGPIIRLTEARLHEVAPLLLEAAADLSEASVASPLLKPPVRPK